MTIAHMTKTFFFISSLLSPFWAEITTPSGDGDFLKIFILARGII
jgi:hypothetical protein